MDDDTFEIRDDNINVEEIMDKLRDNIKKRKAAEELPPDPDSLLLSCAMDSHTEESRDIFQRDLTFIDKNWDIHNYRYAINSHQPFIGKILIKGRQIVNGEVRRYIDPVISWQTEFNASMVRLIIRISQRCDEFEIKSDKNAKEIGKEIDKKILDNIISTKNELDLKIILKTKELAENLERTRRELNAIIEKNTNAIRDELNKEIETRVQERKLIREERKQAVKQAFIDHNSSLDDIIARAGIVHALEERFQKELTQKRTPLVSRKKEIFNYFLFENQFRGSREVIRQRQSEFLPYFNKCSHVLDIGCGRGEFLEILRDNNIGGVGVDSDPDMVAYCHSRQLEVEYSDAVAYLETLEDKSVDGIFIDQVVEHLEPDYFIRLLALCYQKLKFGYYLVVETVNPLTFVSLVNFYADITHKKPVHPETLQYLFNIVGFQECEKKFFSPVSDDGRLRIIQGTADMSDGERKNVDVYNYNIEMLNSLLFGAQDYAVIGRK